MRLESIAVARGGIEVVAARWPAGTCPVLDHLAELERTHPRVWREAIVFLRDHLPNEGLPPVVGRDTSRAKAVSPSRKQLRGSIWELRLSVAQPFRRPLAYRLLYFHHGWSQIVLSNSFLKSERPAVDPLDAAEWTRAAYWADLGVSGRGGER